MSLKITFARGPLLLQKYKILKKCRQKLVTLKEHDMYRGRFDMSR